MAWRPYENLIGGELDNRIPGKVTGWIRFFRLGKKPLRVTLDLAGDFHEDIRGKIIRLTNPEPQDRNEELGREGTYMEGICRVQRGVAGDITAGLSLGPWNEELARKLMAQNELVWDDLGIQGQQREEQRQKFARQYRERIQAEEPFYPYVPYPYIEWYSDQNGRVVLELDASQVEVLEEEAAVRMEKTPQEVLEAERKRTEAMGNFMAGMLREVSKQNRRSGGDGNVFGELVG